MKEKDDATAPEETGGAGEGSRRRPRSADRLNGEWKRNSLLGRAGLFLEPAFRPLGWDWKIGMAALASFPAREVIVGTLGIIYDVGDVDAGAIGDDDGRRRGEGEGRGA